MKKTEQTVTVKDVIQIPTKGKLIRLKDLNDRFHRVNPKMINVIFENSDRNGCTIVMSGDWKIPMDITAAEAESTIYGYEAEY